MSFELSFKILKSWMRHTKPVSRKEIIRHEILISNCATNHMILNNSLVFQGLSFHTYKMKERAVPVSNQYKF